LTDNLEYLVNQWKVGGTYRFTLALPDDVAVRNIYLGITTLVSAELTVERMTLHLEMQIKKTNILVLVIIISRDIALNLQGVINVYGAITELLMEHHWKICCYKYIQYNR
jgi:putative iron-regulated protein